MKFSVAMLSISALLSGGNAAGSERRLHKEFMSAMHSDSNIKQAHRKKAFQEAKKAKFFEKLMGSARKLQDNDYYNGQVNWNDQVVYGGQYNYNPGEDQYGAWVWGQNQYGFDMAVAFDMTSRAFKYAGCAAIKSFDSDMAEATGDPMTMETYAVFRLCPADSCNKYSMTGCGKNYGEYAVEMKTYLQYVLDYYEAKYDDYCGYCSACDYDIQQYAYQEKYTCQTTMKNTDWESAMEQENDMWQNYNDGNENNNYYNNGANRKLQNNYYNNNNGNNYNNMNGNYNGNNYNQYNQQQDQYNQQQDQYNQYQDQYQAQYEQYQDQYMDNQQSYQNFLSMFQICQAQAQQAQQGENAYNQYQDQNQQYGNQQYNQNQANQQYNNQYNQNNNQYNQNNANRQLQYGYYNQNGEWVEGGNGQNQNGQNQNGQNGQNNYQNYQGYQNLQNQFSSAEDMEEMLTSDTACMCASGDHCSLCDWQMEQDYGVCDDYVCSEYYTYCSDYYGDSEEKQGLDVAEFLECTAYEVEETEQIYYIAPHCGSDHYTISLGVFSDENCANFIGETVSLASILGYTHDDDDLFSIPKDCISCDGIEEYVEDEEEYNQNGNGDADNEDEQYYKSRYDNNYGDQQQQNQNQNQNGGQNNYYNNNNQQNQQNQNDYTSNYYMRQQQRSEAMSYVKTPETDEDGVVAMCSALYDNSAQCNSHMSNHEQQAMYMTSYELQLETRYCSFIENIVYGSYDEQGEILLKGEQFDFKDWTNVQQYKKLKMPAGQAVGLALSVILCVSLAATAIFMQRSMTRKSEPWKPKRLSGSDLNRQNSGIVMGRSRSGPGTAPLI